MDRVDHCRGRADQADRQAERANDPESKRMYKEIAAAWRRLADFIGHTKLDKVDQSKRSG